MLKILKLPYNNPYKFRITEANDPGPIPPVGVDWDRLENIMQYFPDFQIQYMERLHKIKNFNKYIWIIHLCKIITRNPKQQ
jgi:hypothetical protein